MELKQRVDQVYERIAAAAKAAGRNPEEITLCAATKVQSDQTIRDAIAAGITVCGENRVQELTGHLQADAYAGAKQVHFIGHLQTNKVKQVVGLVDLIHSVDSERLLRAIDAQAAKVGKVQDILLEVNIGREEIRLFRDMTPAEQDEAVKRDPRYGRIICRCECVSEAEIVQAIHSPIPARSIDAVKRRLRAGMGRCQGGFCAPRIIGILARELGCSETEIMKNQPGSYMVAGKSIDGGK